MVWWDVVEGLVVCHEVCWGVAGFGWVRRGLVECVVEQGGVGHLQGVEYQRMETTVRLMKWVDLQ
jgi:hypothetical protein